MKKTKTEIRDWLLNNAVDKEGDLMISGLDFSDFDGDVFMGNMKVKGNLYQSTHEVEGSLIQSGHGVKGSLYQSDQEVKGHLFNKNNKYGGDLVESPSTKLLKEVTHEELAELGYTLKGDKND